MAITAFFTLNWFSAAGSETGRVATLLKLKHAEINVADQDQSELIHIGKTALTMPGFVVIYDDEEGPGKILGVSGPLPKGVTRELTVPLQQPPAAGYYYAMIHRDDGDGTFSPEEDEPVRDSHGAIVMTRFLASTGE
jgi:hypothetical protein